MPLSPNTPGADPSFPGAGWWRGKRVVVTGGSGFVGSHVVELLAPLASSVIVPTRRPNQLRSGHWLLANVQPVALDLQETEKLAALFRGVDVVLALAARVAGVGWARTHPATLLRDNLLPFASTLEAARLAAVPRLLVCSSACVYPADVPVPTPESAGHLGEPEPSKAAYGHAKRMQEVLADQYRAEFGLHIAVARPNNTFGPRDRFDPATAHVVAALIARALDPGQPTLQLWGSGEQTRSFLYVRDVAAALLVVAAKAEPGDVVNLDGEEEVTLAQLAAWIAELAAPHVGFLKPVVCDRTKPEGLGRRHCTTERMTEMIGFRPATPLREGLDATIAWYARNAAAQPRDG